MGQQGPGHLFEGGVGAVAGWSVECSCELLPIVFEFIESSCDIVHFVKRLLVGIPELSELSLEGLDEFVVDIDIFLDVKDTAFK